MMVLVLRFLDRVGKGLRTAPRDALIADVTPSEQRGYAYGVHRAMDHAGSVLGPLIAGAMLGWGLNLRSVFAFAAVPALLTVLVLLFGVKEPKLPRETTDPSRRLATPWAAWRESSPEYRRLLTCLLVFTLSNASDAFLLLRLSKAGIPASWVVSLWAAFSAIKMVASFLGGRLADHAGHSRMIVAGWFFYALIYLGFAWCTDQRALIAIFLSYGLFFGLTEPAERAMVSIHARKDLRGNAFGLFHSVTGLAALPASLLCGWLWSQFGPSRAFEVSAVLSTCAALLFLQQKKAAQRAPERMV
jgi:MFS family permease